MKLLISVVSRVLSIGTFLSIEARTKPFNCSACINTWTWFSLVCALVWSLWGVLPALIAASGWGLLAFVLSWTLDYKIDKISNKWLYFWSMIVLCSTLCLLHNAFILPLSWLGFMVMANIVHTAKKKLLKY